MKQGLVLGAALLALLTACAPGADVATKPASAPIPAVENRGLAVGNVYVWERHDGSQVTSTIVEKEAGTVWLESSDGCRYSTAVDAFAPNAEWTNCGGSSGSQTSKRLSGSIFPLTLGSVESWEYSGTNNNGNSWASTRNCKVEGEVSVTVPAGTFDTFHVRCADKWWVREWFVRADGVTVQWNRTRKTGSADRNRVNKLVSFTPATG